MQPRLSPILLLLLLLPQSVSADVVFDNYGGVPRSGGHYVLGPESDSIGCPHDMALKFILPAGRAFGFTLDSATLPLRISSFGYMEGANTWLTVSIHSDYNGRPGMALESAQIDVPTRSSSNYTINFSGIFLFRAGFTYWIVLRGITDSHHIWEYSNPYSTGSTLGGYKPTYIWSIMESDVAAIIEGTPRNEFGDKLQDSLH
jgi:hypothetical protein